MSDLPPPAHRGPDGTGSYFDSYTAEQMRAYAAQAVAAERDLWAMEAREALELIAAPMRPDGTWNRDREACRALAAEVLGKG